MTNDTITISKQKPINYQGKQYCPFCGRELVKHTTFIDHYDEYTWYDCDCKDYVESEKIFNEIKSLSFKMPSAKYYIKTTITLEKK